MNLRDYSKNNFNSAETLEHINAGSFQRIADAAEKMALNFSSLIEERNRYKLWFQEERGKVEELRRVNRALRGVITRQKKKCEVAK